MVNSKEYMREYMLKRYYLRKAKAVEQLGGRCVRCGTTENLEFDHIDRSTKAFTIGRIINSVSEVRLQEELAKCQLLCETCHIIKGTESKDQGQTVHGGGLTGKRNCRCEL